MTAIQLVRDIELNTPSTPHILFIGDHFDLSAPKNLRILKLKWNLILTSSCNSELLIHITKSLPSYREVREINDISSDDFYKPDSRNLKVIRLFKSSERSSPLSDRNAQKLALDVASSIWNRTLKYGGRWVAVGYSKDDLFSFDKMSELLSDCVKRENEAVFFGVDSALAETLLELGTDISEYRSCPDALCVYSEEMGELLDVELDDEDGDDADADYIQYDDSKIKIFINGEPRFIEKTDTVKLSTFATLLNEDELNKVYVPPQYVESYFSMFLEQSASSPEWYGYKEGFNLLRIYEEELFAKTLAGLANPSAIGKENAPICLKGESGSGKSVAVANLAYRIYTQKQYPVIYINGRTLKTLEADSENLNILEDILRLLESEEMKARCTLIVWDLSMFESDVAKFRSVYSTLKNTWFRNVQFVCTAYENIDEQKNSDFQFVTAPLPLSKEVPQGQERSELARLKTLLKRKARWDAEEIDKTIELLRASEEMRKSFMIILHKLFRDTRPNIEKSMRDYVSRSLKTALLSGTFDEKKGAYNSEAIYKTSFEKAFDLVRDEIHARGILVDADKNISEQSSEKPEEKIIKRIENMLKTTAICSKYGLGVPFDMVMRLTGLYDARIKDAISLVAYLEYDESDLGDYSIRFRTRYEANIYLKAFDIDRAGEIQAIVNIIKNMKTNYSYDANNAELRLVVDLLARIGSNSKDFRDASTRLQLDDYPEIIEALASYRKKEYMLPELVVQEVSYIREYCIEKKELKAISTEELSRRLNEAITLCNEAIIVEGKRPYSRSIKNLIVEKASCKTRLLEYCTAAQLDAREYEVMMNQLSIARRMTPGDPYVVNAILWFMAWAYSRLPSDQKSMDKKAEIERTAPDFIDSIQCEYADIAKDTYFTTPVNKLLEQIDEALSEEYIEGLIGQNNPSGYYLKAYKELRRTGLSEYKRDSFYTDEEAALCGRICQEVFGDKLEAVRDFRCLRMVLRLKWIAYNKQELFGTSEQWTYMNDEQWREVRRLCDICDVCNADTLIFFYFKALACCQLKDYPMMGEAITIIRNATEDQGFRGLDRVRVRHMICEDDGVPRVFGGKFNSRMPDDEKSGNYVEISEINRKYNRNNRDIYFFKNNFVTPTTLRRGQSYSDFQLGLGYMGLAAYRGYARKLGDRYVR